MITEQLPKRARASQIGQRAIKAFHANRPDSWEVTDYAGDTDYGIDFDVQLVNDAGNVWFSFYLQLKGTESLKISSCGEKISFPLKSSTLNYYYNLDNAVILIVTDLKSAKSPKNCESYYLLLDEIYISRLKSKLDEQGSVTVTLPVEQLFSEELDVSNWCIDRLHKKMDVQRIESTFDASDKDVGSPLSLVADYIEKKPAIINSMQSDDDSPWVDNPEGTICYLLKRSQELISANQIHESLSVLKEVETKAADMTEHELAELFHQKGKIESIHGNDRKSTDWYLKAKRTCSIQKYKLSYIESLFRLDDLPDVNVLTEIESQLSIHDYKECLIKSKCLALMEKEEQAYNILVEHHPNKIVGQMIILTILGLTEKLDNLILEASPDELISDREKFIFHVMASRRFYFRGVGDSNNQDEIIPIYGKIDYDINSLAKALEHLEKAWRTAKLLGYPSDSILLLDVSPIIFNLFNKLDTLLEHLEAMLKEREFHPLLLRSISQIIFNKGEYDRVIELIEAIKSPCKPGDCVLLIFSYYHNQNITKALELIKINEELLLAKEPNNAELVFCIGAEIAEELFENEVASHFLDIVSSFENGDALQAIRIFLKNCRENPKQKKNYCNELFQKYLELDNSIVIAEQLFAYFSAYDEQEATKIEELGKCILKHRELSPNDYLHYTQSLATLNKWEEVEVISDRNIDRGNYASEWDLVKAASLEKQGRPAEALRLLEGNISRSSVKQQKAEHFAQLSLRLGLLDKAEQKLNDLLHSAKDNETKLRVIESLIFIYSSDSSHTEKLAFALYEYGRIVDQNDCQTEGQYLLFFMTLTNNEQISISEQLIEQFRVRLTAYTDKFPDSPILRKRNIDLGKGGDAVIATLRSLSGVSDAQVTKWKRNKNLIRAGKMPVPFCMLHRYIDNTQDIFSSWVYGLNNPPTYVEYKLRHASMAHTLDLEKELFDNHKTLLLEESSLLVLNELGLLDLVVRCVPKLAVLKGVYLSYSRFSHPMMGSVFSTIPSKIINSLGEQLDKITLIPNNEEMPFESYSLAIGRGDFVLLSDDFNLVQLISLKEKELDNCNVFNILQLLAKKELVTNEQGFDFISKFCQLGIYQPNMSTALFSNCMIFFLSNENEVDYSQTKFALIFEKVFDLTRDKFSAFELFINSIIIAVVNYKFKIKSESLLDMVRAFLLRFNFTSVNKFCSMWFIYSCIFTDPIYDNEFIPKSDLHSFYWNVYNDLLALNAGKDVRLIDSLKLVIEQVSKLKDEHLTLAHKHIKSAFIDYTEESELFERLYQEMSITKKIEAIKAN